MARDWRTAFRPAFFRGVPFKVESEEPEGARRVAVSPIAYSDDNVDEDFGREPRIVRLTAYCAGEIADAEALALVGALEASGAGLLVLPWMPPMQARALSWRARRERDRAGYVGFDVEFMKKGLSAAPASGSGLGGMADTMQAGAALLRGLFA